VRNATCNMSATPDIKTLANAALSRLGKRNTPCNADAIKGENRCCTPPKNAPPQTPPVQHLFSPGRATAWEPGIAALVEWFLKTSPPAEPFNLYQGVTVLRPVHFWQYLEGDIAAGPGKARAYTGAVQKDLRRLAELFGGAAKFVS
jgi:hypothetical protein